MTQDTQVSRFEALPEQVQSDLHLVMYWSEHYGTQAEANAVERLTDYFAQDAETVAESAITEMQQRDRERLARITELEAQLAAASQWQPAQYNDIINLDNGNELRVVIDQGGNDKRTHLHIRKRKDGEWQHIGLTTINPDFAIVRRTPAAGEKP